MIVTVNYSGLSSAYSTPFSDPSLFQSLVNEALTKARAQADLPDTLTWDKLAVSSFSAGYGAVREILKSSTYRSEINSLLAADSCYATTAADGTPLDSQMVDYKTFAGLAQAGAKTFIYSHSQVPTYTYENTAECGDELMQSLHITPTATTAVGLGTLEFYRKAQSGNFQLWGATGMDGDSHLEHLRYIGQFLKDMPLARIPTLAGDFTKDGPVNGFDLATWRTSYGSTSAADADKDNDSDGADFLTLQRQLGQATPSTISTAVAIPEPTAAVLIAFAAIILCGHPQARACRAREAVSLRCGLFFS
jgi:hypothetical protein